MQTKVEQYLKNNYLFISVITEMELLGWYKITEQEKIMINSILKNVTIVDFSQQIKEISITLKQRSQLKLPDAIIAATSINLGFPLVSFDKGLQKIKNLNLVLLS